MRIYLDTSQLINLLERGNAGISPPQFNEMLRHGNHTLALSFVTVCELSTLLWNPRSDVVVTRTLNTLEEFPLEWIDLAKIHNLEVSYGLACHKLGFAYDRINPFVPSFVDTIQNPPRTIRMFLQYRLSEAVFDMWRSGQFDYQEQSRRLTATFRQIMEQERQLLATLRDRTAARRELFIRKVVERIQNHRLHTAEDTGNAELFREFAERVYADSSWCPTVRLSFEVFHALVNNVGDQLDEGDLNDLIHLWAVPYVDFITTDRRIAAYLAQVSERLGKCCHQKLRQNIKKLVASL